MCRFKKPNLRVQFKDESKLVDVKTLETELFMTATIEKEEEVIRRCKTQKEIDDYSDMLLKKLRELKAKKVYFIIFEKCYDFENFFYFIFL